MGLLLTLDVSRPPPADDRTCILLVERNVTLRNILSVFFTTEGYFVLTAATEGEAQEVLREYAGTVRAVISGLDPPQTPWQDGTFASLAPAIKCELLSLVGSAGWSFRKDPLLPGDLADKLRQLLQTTPHS